MSGSITLPFHAINRMTVYNIHIKEAYHVQVKEELSQEL